MQPYVAIKFDSYKLNSDFDGLPVCEWCEVRRSQDIDHIWGRRWILKLDRRNLIFVCRKCHMEKGGKKWKIAATMLVHEKLERIWWIEISPLSYL